MDLTKRLMMLAIAVCCASHGAGAQAEYVIGSRDVLFITVWNQPDLSGKYMVDAEGSFSFPLIGRIRVGGLTLQKVEAEIRTRLATGFLTNPQVIVAIDQFESQRFFVVGEVRQAGSFPLTRDTTVVEALARAGSTTPTASSEVMVVRRPPGDTSAAARPAGESDGGDVLKVNLEKLHKGALSENVKLRDGDTVIVPRAEVLTVYVFGQVRNPGVYTLPKGSTVVQALAMAGGVSDRGSTRRIRVNRLVGGKNVESGVKLNDRLQDGDTINVRRRFF